MTRVAPPPTVRNGWGSVATGGAAHEAAHAVLAWVHGCPVDRIVLHTTGDGAEWRSGFTQIRGALDRNPLADGIVVAAGAEGHAQWLIHQGVGEGEAHRLGAQSAVGDSGYIRDLLRRYPDELSEAGIRSAAAREVAQHWERIERVANELAERHRLSGARAKR